MSVKTPVFAWDTPVLGEEANVPADLLSLATEIENTVKALEIKRLKTAGAGDVKKLIIVSATGEPVWRALSGDVTTSETGVITIANEAVTAAKILALAITEAKLAGESVATAKIAALAVTAAKLAAEAVETAKIANLAVTEGKLGALAVSTAKLAELAVTTAKIADAAVTSRKAKLTNGLLTNTAALECAEAYADVVGGKLEITPEVASILLITATFNFAIANGNPAGTVAGIGSISVDGAAENASVAKFSFLNLPEVEAPEATVCQIYRIPLTAALHTIKMRAKKIGNKNVQATKEQCQLQYMLVAS